MISLTHLDLPSPTPQATMAFFTTHMGFIARFTRADGLIVAEDAAGFVLTISPLPAGSPATYPHGFHVGALVADDDAVRREHARLLTAGATERFAPCLLGGALTSQVLIPGGIPVEITVRRG